MIIQVRQHNISLPDTSPVAFVKAFVEPSQRTGEKAHKSWLCLDKKKWIHCKCTLHIPRWFGEASSHDAALMFAIEAVSQCGINALLPLH